MALFGALSRSSRALAPLDPEWLSARQVELRRVGLGIREIPEEIAQGFAAQFWGGGSPDSYTLGVQVSPRFRELFPSLDEFYNKAWSEYLEPARYAINNELKRVGLCDCKVRRIRFEEMQSLFMVEFMWIKPPTTLQKLLHTLRPRSH